MPSTLLARFLGRFTSSEDTDSDSRFVRSQLDWSVRYGEDGGREEANREIAKIQQEAEKREGRHR